MTKEQRTEAINTAFDCMMLTEKYLLPTLMTVTNCKNKKEAIIRKQ